MNIFILITIMGLNTLGKKSKDIKIYPKLGLLTESTDQIILVNGLANGDISLRLNLPKLEIENNDSTCAASKTENFKATLESAVDRFRKEMATELGDILGEEVVPENSVFEKLGPIEINNETIMSNPNLCNEKGVRCEWFPLVEDDPTNENHHTIVPCYDSTLGKTSSMCKSEEGVTMCCSRTASKNVGKCPNDLTRAIKAIEVYLADFPDRTYTMGHGVVKMKNVHNFCFSLLNAHYNRKRIYQGSHNRGSTDRFLPRHPRDLEGLYSIGNNTSDSENEYHGNNSIIGNDSIQYKTSNKGDIRVKRSNWSYLTSGWIFSSSYIDSNVQNVLDLEKADTAALKNALKSNSKSLLKIEADAEERKNLFTNVCGVVGVLSEETLMNHLRTSQFKLEQKAESMLRICSDGRVPDYVGSHHLIKLCSAVSDSSTCSNQNLRDLFQCSVTRPQITLDFVGVNLKLIFRIPVSESYQSFRIYTTGVPFKSATIDTKFNITENAEKIEVESGNSSSNEDVKKALAEILRDALVENRSRRELGESYHFLALRHIPEILISHEGDILLFYERDCKNLGRIGGMSCDYGMVTTQHTKCVAGILGENTSKIEHYCSISLFSSSADCMTKPIGSLGYLISSHSPVSITNSKDSKVFRNKNNIHTCSKVCFIGLAEQNKFFSCGDRDFSLQNESPIEIKFSRVDIKQTDLSALSKVRHHELNDLSLSGFENIDKNVNRATFTKLKTVSTIFTIVSVVILVSLTAFCILRKIRYVIYNALSKVCIRNPYGNIIQKSKESYPNGMDYTSGGSY